MTPARFRDVLALLGLTERGLARLIGYSPGAVRNWSAGKARVPPEIAAWLERRAADPPPPRQHDRRGYLRSASPAGRQSRRQFPAARLYQ